MSRQRLYIGNCTPIWKIQQHAYFVSSWKSIYRKRQSAFDRRIRIVCRLLQNYVRTLTQGFSQTIISDFHSPLTMKIGNFTIHLHFVSSWKSIYWKKWLTLDGAIRIVHWLLQNYIRNLTLKHLFQNSPPLPAKNLPILWHTAILFLDLKKKKERERERERGDQIIHTATAWFFFLQSALFLHRKCLFW